MVVRYAVALVVLIVTALVNPATAVAGGGCHNEASATVKKADGDVEVRMSKCAFSPSVLYVDEGTSVGWVNDDPLPHTVTGLGMTWGGLQELSRGDDTKPIPFDEPGVYPYSCVLHPGMVGAVVVGNFDDSIDDADVLQAAGVGGGPDGGARPSEDGGAPLGSIAVVTSVLVMAAGGFFVRRRTRPVVAVDEDPALQR